MGTSKLAPRFLKTPLSRVQGRLAFPEKVIVCRGYHVHARFERVNAWGWRKGG